MTQHPLAGIVAKLKRANESLDTLYRGWRDPENEKPFRIAFNLDAQSEWHTAYIADADTTPRLGMLAGESLYQARSSLEHLVWLLVKANHKKPGEHNSFPIHTDWNCDAFLKHHRRPRWGRDGPGKLYGVSFKAAALIEQLQPYNAPRQHQRGHVLRIVDEFARIDRHRTLHGTYEWTDPKAVRPLFVAQARAEIVGFRTLVRRGQRLVPGTKVARLRIKPTARQPKVNVQGDLPLDIAFGNPRSVLLHLKGLYDLNRKIGETISAFEQFL
jgi:hypothetical protein